MIFLTLRGASQVPHLGPWLPESPQRARASWCSIRMGVFPEQHAARGRAALARWCAVVRMGAKAVGRRAGLHYLQVEVVVQTGEGHYLEGQEAQGHVGMGLLEQTRGKQQRSKDTSSEQMHGAL